MGWRDLCPPPPRRVAEDRLHLEDSLHLYVAVCSNRGWGAINPQGANAVKHHMSPSVSVRLLLTQSDARLVAFARAGHERAFEALVRRYRRPLLGYCRRLLLSEERAEDALQQAFMQAWLALQAGTEVRDVRAWLYRIVHNAALNGLRVSGYDYCRLSESLSGADAPEADLDRRIAVREALAGLAALPEMQREALLRTAVEGRTHQQVARELGLSENALRGLVYRARATLRAAAGAIVPPPLVSWALASGMRATPLAERVAELGAGSGGVGVAALLMKGGAVAVTAGVVAGGVVTVQAHHRSARHPSRLAAGGMRSVVASTGQEDADPIGGFARVLPGRPPGDPRRTPRMAGAPRERGSGVRTISLPALSPANANAGVGPGEPGHGERHRLGGGQGRSQGANTGGGQALGGGDSSGHRVAGESESDGDDGAHQVTGSGETGNRGGRDSGGEGEGSQGGGSGGDASSGDGGGGTQGGEATSTNRSGGSENHHDSSEASAPPVAGGGSSKTGDPGSGSEGVEEN
jgi:RNA polymerase sigma factor (sigma-70 family)